MNKGFNRIFNVALLVGVGMGCHYCCVGLFAWIWLKFIANDDLLERMLSHTAAALSMKANR